MSHVVVFAFDASKVEDDQLEILIYQASEHFKDFNFRELAVVPKDKFNEETQNRARQTADKLYWRVLPPRRGSH